MRLNNEQINIIKKIVTEKIGDVEIYIFGSRLNDNVRGGDVDIFINKRLNFNQKIELKILLEDMLFLPVDIVDSKNKNRLIEKEALKGVKI
jgi:predicted nucleotidyltransferase